MPVFTQSTINTLVTLEYIVPLVFAILCIPFYIVARVKEARRKKRRYQSFRKEDTRQTAPCPVCGKPMVHCRLMIDPPIDEWRCSCGYSTRK